MKAVCFSLHQQLQFASSVFVTADLTNRKHFVNTMHFLLLFRPLLFRQNHEMVSILGYLRGFYREVARPTLSLSTYFSIPTICENLGTSRQYSRIDDYIYPCSHHSFLLKNWTQLVSSENLVIRQNNKAKRVQRSPSHSSSLLYIHKFNVGHTNDYKGPTHPSPNLILVPCQNSHKWK